MKITNDKEYYSIPNGTKLLVILTGKDWEENHTIFVVEKEGLKLKDYNRPNEYWCWKERNCEDLEFTVQTITTTPHIDRHLKGYIYDSLVYRYQLALEKGIEPLICRYMEKEGLSRADATVRAREVNMRDTIRFCEILNEAIGEHD